ncbi:unnamed protein product [Fusarium graminearum]|uniref:Uncharacterized protein n=1 Tax=Gibberella zeae TaxID=5518 RepID=A0A2H3GJY2_GIBZA|nr:hypothetical protein FGRA07_10280 [Fusarium graminearum]CAF3499382.1 unnamed protein product [Fusarium graminearum]VTO91980.1 unnamed protein product [Fusarium graminearum]
MSNWTLPSEITLFKRKLLRRLKWINMVRPNVAVRKIVLDHEGLPGRSRMPTEREDFLPIETTVEELEEVIRTPDIEESLMLKDDHGVNILPLLTLQSMLRDRPPVTHDIWEDALQRLDKLLAGGRQGGADWCRKHRVFEIFCVVMIARQKCKDDLTVLNNITSYASVRLNQFNLFNTLKSVVGIGETGLHDGNLHTHTISATEISALEEHLSLWTTSEVIISPVAISYIRNVLGWQQNYRLLSMLDEVI